MVNVQRLAVTYLHLQQQAKPWPNNNMLGLALLDGLVVRLRVRGGCPDAGRGLVNVVSLPACQRCLRCLFLWPAQQLRTPGRVGAKPITVRLARTPTPGRIRLEAAKLT